VRARNGSRRAPLVGGGNPRFQLWNQTVLAHIQAAPYEKSWKIYPTDAFIGPEIMSEWIPERFAHTHEHWTGEVRGSPQTGFYLFLQNPYFR
jgi:hypothetical protein